MTEPISSVVRTGSTPQEANLFVAILRGAGIPAFTDGATPDEFSMSQQMMNLTSVKVKVPTDALERAEEVLAKHDEEGGKIDLEELTRQALEAENPNGPPIGQDRE